MSQTIIVFKQGMCEYRVNCNKKQESKGKYFIEKLTNGV